MSASEMNLSNEIETREIAARMAFRAWNSPNAIAARNADREAAEWRADTTGCLIYQARNSSGYTTQERADFAALADRLGR